jgi:TolB-like protein/Flp pilus assembly protein TadD
MQFLFDNHILDIHRRELHRGSMPVPVEPQVFDLLIYLLQNRDRVVSKDDLIASVWGGRIVSDATLASRINAARKAVADNGEEQRLIRTVVRRGIRFVGTVRVRADADEPVQAAPAPAGAQQPVHAAQARSDQPAIAVLPFVNMSGEQAQEYFSDGISEDIITALSKVRWFLVIARNSSFVYKGRAVPMKRIAEELGVGYLVEGSVRRSGDLVRITAQLSDVTTGSQLWGERYDRSLADVFAVQDEITEAIVAAIEPQVYAAENFHAQRKAPHSLRAWDLVMRALSHFWRVTREDNRTAQRLLDEAIALDQHYAQALALLALSHTFAGHLGWEDPTAANLAAERAGLAAIRADGDDPWAHLAVGATHLRKQHFDSALAAFESALRLNPSFALAHGHRGLVLSSLGRWQEGTRAARHALRLSPRDPFAAIFSAVAAYAEFVGRNYEEAIRLGRESIRQRPDMVAGYRPLAAAAAMAGDLDLARTTLDTMRQLQPDVSLAWMASHLLISEEAERARYLDAFRRAGLE